jgi:hypothetical protein
MPRAAVEAEQLLEDLGLNEVPVIPEIVCKAMSSPQYPVSIHEKPMSSDGFHGISIGDSKGAAILVNSNISNRHRKRFTAAHEIGHVCLHIQTNIQSKFECSAKDISSGDNSNNNYEKEANQFASSLLMPSTVISPAINKNDLSWTLVEEIKKQCDVSLEAAVRRVISLSKEPCCLIIHKDGKMWSPIKSNTFHAYIPIQHFPNYLETEPDTNGEQSFSDRMNECDFSDWSYPDNLSTGKLFYSTIYNVEYQRTMTLLLHDEDDLDDEDYLSSPIF